MEGIDIRYNAPGTTHQNSWGCKQAAINVDPVRQIKNTAEGDPENQNFVEYGETNIWTRGEL